MKKLFFFRSSTASGNGNNKPPLPSNNDKVYWEKPPESAVESQTTDPKDWFARPGEQYHESPMPAGSGLRRSLSFSSRTIYNDMGLGEKDSSGLGYHSSSPSTSSNLQPHMTDNRIR